MSTKRVSIRIEGTDAADSSEGAMSLRDEFLNRSAERNLAGIEVQLARSDPNAQDVAGDIVNVVHTSVLTGLFIVETIKLWHESHRDKALIIEAKHGSAVRVEFDNHDAGKILEQAISEAAPSSKPD